MKFILKLFLKIWYFCDPLDVYDSNINLVDNRWKPIFPVSTYYILDGNSKFPIEMYRIGKMTVNDSSKHGVSWTLIFVGLSRGGARILVRGGTSDKISYMNCSQVLYCNGVAKISVRGGDIQQKCSHQRFFEKFWKIYKKFAQKLKNSPKFSKMKFNRI